MLSQDKNAHTCKAPLEYTYYYLGILDDRELDFNLFYDIRNTLEDTITTAPEYTAIDIWLTSLGGSAHAAYKIYLELRSKCCQLRMVVPDHASSAATLLSLGMDTIFMAASAELGPLDAQIPNPQSTGPDYISVLDIAHAPKLIGRNVVDFTILSGAELLERTEFSQEYIMQQMLNIALHVYKPFMQQIDAPLYHRASNYIDVLRHYAENILYSNPSFLKNLSQIFASIPNKPADFPSLKEFSLATIRETAQSLTAGYPDHRYLINRDEARYQLRLPVANISSYTLHPYVMHQAKKAEQGTRKRSKEGKSLYHSIAPYFFCYTAAQLTEKIKL